MSRCEADVPSLLKSTLTVVNTAAAIQYYLVALTILCIYATPEQVQDFSKLDMLGREINSTEELLEAFALDICGIAFTTKIPSVLVNAFGPIAYFKSH
ncbi:Fc.00g107650.m01.CDS01 [Cosmosporella sp. VM-42]